MPKQVKAGSNKKLFFPIGETLRAYLKDHGREVQLPVSYTDLLCSYDSFPQKNKRGENTLWETMLYTQADFERINKGLCAIYALLKTDGNMEVVEHLKVSRVDFCTFGNSKPFRIRLVNRYNDNYDYFYVKQADASRIYGLELEHILSPDRINYLVYNDTLIEEHIAGIPGDAFIKKHLKSATLNKVRIAKEFIKFNERCFVKLLGDMRSTNYVIDITPDFEDEQYRIRAIDFDQQCYEGKKSFYLPEQYKDNAALVNFCTQTLNPETVLQYQYEERSLIGKRLYSDRYRIKALVDCMETEQISPREKVRDLARELAEHHQQKGFLSCKNMAEILRFHLKILLWKPRVS